jgi:zinc protease
MTIERTRALRHLELPRVGEPPEPRVPTPIRWALENGLRVVAVPRNGLPNVAMRLFLPAGASADPADRPGTASMVADLLTEGAAGRSADEVNERLDWLGAALSAQVGHDFVEIDMVALSDTLAPALEIFADVVLRPDFPRRETERTRAETLDFLVARLDEPANVADDMAAELVFGADHPYGRLTSGTLQGVEAITREEMAEFHSDHYRPANAVLIVAGDFDPPVLERLVESAFGSWTGAAARAASISGSEGPRRAGELVTVEWPGSAQGEIRFAGTGMPRRSPDWIPAAVANYLLGGSTITGRLGANLREDKGWTYGVRCGFAAAVHPGGWSVETAVDVEVVNAAIDEITAELERFSAEPVSDLELTRAKRALVLSLPRAFETSGRIIGRFGTVEAYGLEVDYWERFAERVQAVTAGDVLRAARTYFPLDRLVWVAVGIPQ